MNLRSFLQSLPSGLQYIAIFALVMVILYVCLTLTRLIGQNRGKKQYYDDPEKCDQDVPDLFASTSFRRKKRTDDDHDDDHEDDHGDGTD